MRVCGQEGRKGGGQSQWRGNEEASKSRVGNFVVESEALRGNLSSVDHCTTVQSESGILSLLPICLQSTHSQRLPLAGAGGAFWRLIWQIWTVVLQRTSRARRARLSPKITRLVIPYHITLARACHTNSALPVQLPFVQNPPPK